MPTASQAMIAASTSRDRERTATSSQPTYPPRRISRQSNEPLNNTSRIVPPASVHGTPRRSITVRTQSNRTSAIHHPVASAAVRRSNTVAATSTETRSRSGTPANTRVGGNGSRIDHAANTVARSASVNHGNSPYFGSTVSRRRSNSPIFGMPDVGRSNSSAAETPRAGRSNTEVGSAAVNRNHSTYFGSTVRRRRRDTPVFEIAGAGGSNSSATELSPSRPDRSNTAVGAAAGNRNISITYFGSTVTQRRSDTPVFDIAGAGRSYSSAADASRAGRSNTGVGATSANRSISTYFGTPLSLRHSDSPVFGVTGAGGSGISLSVGATSIAGRRNAGFGSVAGSGNSTVVGETATLHPNITVRSTGIVRPSRSEPVSTEINPIRLFDEPEAPKAQPEELSPLSPDSGRVICAICLEGKKAIYEKATEIMSTICGHIICELCLSEWMENHNTCPICRRFLIGSWDYHPIFV